MNSPSSVPRPKPTTAWPLRLALALAGIAFAAVAIEVTVRLFMPVNLDFFNWQSIKRPSNSGVSEFEYIPGGRNDFYVGVPVQINSLGMRDVEVQRPKPAGTIRILGIGDSVTFGFGVRLEETYLKVLESDLNAVAANGTRYEVINAGMEGTALDRYYKVLETEAPALQPDLVIIGLTLNDIVDYRQRGVEPETRTFSRLSPTRRINTFLLFHSQAYLASYLRLKSLLYRWQIIDFNEEHWFEIDILKPDSDQSRTSWGSSREILSNIATLARERGYPLMLTVFPEELQLNEPAVERYRRELLVDISTSDALSGQPQQELLRFGTAANVPVLDLLPVFRAASGTELYLRGRSMASDPIHPSPAGHRVAGNAIFAFLEQQPPLADALGLGGRRAQAPH